MFRIYIGLTILLCVSSLLLNGQNEHPANRKVLVQNVIVNGVRAIDTAELNEITKPLNGSVVNDDTEEIIDRLRMSFQGHGYFDAKIESIRIRTADPLANPKPITVEVEVTEGARCQLGEITFSGNHAIASDELRRAFPFHKNETFSTDKVRSGLEALRDAYFRLGYIDVGIVPDAPKRSATTVDLAIEVEEGPQYNMGSLELAGNSNAAEQLRPRWQLEKGQPFDSGYLKKFLDDNYSLLPLRFEMSSAAKIVRNCRDTTVTVFIDLDLEHPSAVPKEVGCDKDSKSSAK